MMATLAKLAGAFLVFLFVLFVVNQTAQVVQLANTFSPLAGSIVLYSLLAVYVATALVPLFIMATLPKPISPPRDQNSPEFSVFIDSMMRRLRRNPHLSKTELREGREGVEQAFALLDLIAKQTIQREASALFLTTAVSQNGRLDGILVLIAQTRLIWKVTRTYNQRPSLGGWFDVYTSVATAVFMANQIEDLDLSEQIQPILTTAISASAMGIVPGMAVAGSIVTSSLLTGAANAYLTLRVGVICQLYCKSLSPFDLKAARRTAAISAGGMLGGIASGAAIQVTKAIVGSVKTAGMSTLDATAERLRGVGSKLNPFGQ